jgi:hypothetical protein
MSRGMEEERLAQEGLRCSSVRKWFSRFVRRYDGALGDWNRGFRSQEDIRRIHPGSGTRDSSPVRIAELAGEGTS